MITDSAAVVLFAIRSAVKLGQQARQAYVDSTRRRELFLPLPNFFTGTNEIDARDFFSEAQLGKRFVEGYDLDGQHYEGSLRLKDLLARFAALKEPEKKELVDLHVKYRNILLAEENGGKLKDGDPVRPEELYALFTIQQWRRGADPTPSTLHRIAGTLVEIGIDYALTDPNLFDRNSSHGKALMGFLSALNEIDFKEGDPAELPSQFFVAVMETAAEHPALLSGDPKVQEFIKVTTKGLSTDVNARIRRINGDPALDAIARHQARRRVGDWAGLVFRSTLSSGGRLVLSNPGSFLGVADAGGQALISSVGSSVLDLALANKGGIQNVLSRDGLETILTASLKTVGEHPEILRETNNEGLKKLLSGLATELSQVEDLLSLDVLPEVARMTLEQTGENLDLFWPDLKNHPEQNLLITAARTTLEILSRAPKAGEQWKPRFRREDLLTLTETVLDQFAANPGWLLDDDGKLSGTLREMLEAGLAVLRRRGDNRLSAALAAQLLGEVLRAAVRRKEFLDKLPNGQPLIIAALDAVVSAIFADDLDPKAAWQLLRAEAICGVTQVAMESLAKSGLDPESVAALEQVLDSQIAALVKGKLLDLESFGKALTRKLAA